MTFPLTDDFKCNSRAIFNKYAFYSALKFEMINARLIDGLNCQENDCATEPNYLNECYEDSFLSRLQIVQS